MALRKLTPEMLESVQRGLFRHAMEEAIPAVEADAEGIVSVTMDSRFELTRVSMGGSGVSGDELARLERATMTCVNLAIQEVARRNAERLAESLRDLS